MANQNTCIDIQNSGYDMLHAGSNRRYMIVAVQQVDSHCVITDDRNDGDGQMQFQLTFGYPRPFPPTELPTPDSTYGVLNITQQYNQHATYHALYMSIENHFSCM